MAEIETETETGSPKMSTVKNPTFTEFGNFVITFIFYLTQIQVVPFQCNHFFYLKPQGHQIWASSYPKICRFLLTFSILQYLVGFIFYPTM
jgi:hypothetical protein